VDTRSDDQQLLARRFNLPYLPGLRLPLEMVTTYNPKNDHKMFTRLYTLNIYIFNHIHHIESYKLNTIDVSCYPKDAVPSWILSLQPMAGEPGRQQITEM